MSLVERMRWLLIAGAFAVCLGNGVVAHALDQMETTTYYDKDTDAYITTGTAKINGSIARLGMATSEYDKYRVWSLEGINGGASNPRRFISLIRDIQYRKAEGKQYFDVTYDVDLIWPFGSTGNQLPFEITGEVWDGELLQRMVASLAADSFFIDRFDLSLELIEVAGSSAVKFVCQMKLSPIVDAFFSLEKYRKNIEWRILRVIGNLQGYVAAQSLNQ